MRLRLHSVRYLLGDRVGHKNSLVAAQQDKLCLLKLVPSNLMAYVLYSRACLEFQQSKVWGWGGTSLSV